MKQVIFAGRDNLLNNAATEYNGLMGGLNWNAGEQFRRQIVSAAGTIKYLRVILNVAPGVGEDWVFTLMLNGAPTALTCTIADAATSNSDMANSVAVVVGDSVSLRCATTGSPVAADAYWTTVFDSTTAKESLIMAGTDIAVNNSATEYDLLAGGRNWNATEANRRQLIAGAGSISHLYVQLDVDPGFGGDAYRFTLMLNGNPTALTCTITADDTTGNDVANSVAVVAGDYVSMRCEPLDGPIESPRATYGVKFTATTDGESPLLGGSAQDLDDTLTEYAPLNAQFQNWTVTEADARQAGQACTLKDLYILLDGAPGAGNSYTFTLRKGGGATLLAVTINDPDTTGSDVANDIAVANDELVGFEVNPASTPTVRVALWGLVCFVAPAAPSGIEDKSAGMAAKMIAGKLI